MATSSTPSSIVGRLTARAVVWAAVIALTLSGVALWQFWRASVRALDAQLVAAADAVSLEIVVREGLLEVDVPADRRAALGAGDWHYGVYDDLGRRLDGDAPRLPDGLRPAAGTTTRDGYREAWRNGPRGSLVRVGRPLGPLEADAWRMAASLLVASLVTLLLGAPLTVWLRHALARSLAQFERTAREMAPGRSSRLDLARVDTELLGVARQLNEAFDRLEAGLRREQQLTADASHELRTPVTTILTETEWALSRDRGADEYRAALDVCRRQGRRLKDLTESLLVLARIESGTAPPRRDHLQIGAIVDQAIEDVAERARARDIRVWRQGDARVQADRVQVGILMANLLGNAVRYNRAGGEVEVRVAETPARGVTVEVRDTGPGLNAEDMDRVFDRFWRADPSRKAGEGGTGLGLAISKAIAEAHGGTIRCESASGGATFIVELPHRADHQA